MVGQLEATDLVRDGAREGALLAAAQLAFQQRRGDRGTATGGGATLLPHAEFVYGTTPVHADPLLRNVTAFHPIPGVGGQSRLSLRESMQLSRSERRPRACRDSGKSRETIAAGAHRPQAPALSSDRSPYLPVIRPCFRDCGAYERDAECPSVMIRRISASALSGNATSNWCRSPGFHCLMHWANNSK